MKFLTLSKVGLISSILITQAANAEIITYEIKNSGGGLASGLVTGEGGTPHPYWRFEPGSTFQLDREAGTGSLSATLINNLGIPTPLELELSGLLDTLDGTNHYYIQGNGAPYNPARQDYFTHASGTFDYQPLSEPFQINPDEPISGNSVFQIGEGANYIDPESFGFAAWLEFIHPETGRSLTWDIYGDLHRTHPTDVPEPTPLALLGISLAGLVAARRRRRKSAAA